MRSQLLNYGDTGLSVLQRFGTVGHIRRVGRAEKRLGARIIATVKVNVVAERRCGPIGRKLWRGECQPEFRACVAARRPRLVLILSPHTASTRHNILSRQTSFKAECKV